MMKSIPLVFGPFGRCSTAALKGDMYHPVPDSRFQFLPPITRGRQHERKSFGSTGLPVRGPRNGWGAGLDRPHGIGHGELSV